MKRRYTWLKAAGLLAAQAGWALAADEAESSSVRGIEGRIAVYAATNTPREAPTGIPPALADHPTNTTITSTTMVTPRTPIRSAAQATSGNPERA